MSDELFMNRALFLAQLGRGKVMPNPMVGSVIVHDGEIIGEGYHQEYGKAHAEVNAVASVQNKDLLKESTIYVTLEPCAHFGKTPPCAELIVKSGFKRVVIAQLDPHEKVAGKGVKLIEEAGIKVDTGVLEKESRFLNRRFNNFHENHKPYVILKWAETEDGFIGRLEEDKSLGTWMTSEASKHLVHEMRAEEMAILVGTNTVKFDDPELTVRMVEGQNPLRVIIDRKKSLNDTYKVFNDKAETLLVSEGELIKNWNELWDELLDILYQKGIQTVIVEGGQKILNDIISKEKWNEALKFVAPQNWERGVKAPEGIDKWELLNDDLQGDCLYRALK